MPVFAFLLLGIYGKVIWLIISAVIIGVGHIGIHILHLRTLKNKSVKETMNNNDGKAAEEII